MTDKFFEEVKVDGGDLYIRLLGGEELRIPIVSDFFCRIVTPTEGVQTFDAGPPNVSWWRSEVSSR